jgi:hypothetical protein
MVLEIDSPEEFLVVIESMYLDVLRLRQQWSEKKDLVKCRGIAHRRLW